MQKTVIEHRECYLGGSDIPALLGISKYKTRFQLLKEKAQIVPVEPVFVNKAIEYGVTMEPKIREYLNIGRSEANMFKEWKFERPLEGSTLRARGHLDGYAAASKVCLEIKTTNDYRGADIRAYEDYLFQMLFYMDQPRPRLKTGILAVYERPDDYNETFEPERLHVFSFELSEMKPEIKRLRAEIEKFLADLQYMICNPEKSEIELLNMELKTASENVLAFEKTIAELKEKEAEFKALKEELAGLMVQHGVKSFEAGGYQITLIDEIPESTETVKECDIDALELFFPDAAAECVQEVEKKKAGRRAAVRITKRKGGADHD
jgi:hypothetical protein